MTRPADCNSRGFSLIELLLSVFILAIGIISVSALFPAGIAQQQQSADDQLGPVIAAHALGTLRSRVRSADFGTFEEFGVFDVLGQSVASQSFAYRPSPGDWSWIRPAVVRQAQANLLALPPAEQPGTIDIFAAVAQRPGPPGPGTGGGAQEFCEFPEGIVGGLGITLYGAPYSTVQSLAAPAIFVSQRERWWPSVPSGATVAVPPQYAWECMFRRSGGRVQVAIFVFRVVGVGGALKAWNSAPLGQPGTYDNAIGAGMPALPPVPYRRVTVSSSASASIATTGPDSGPQLAPGWWPNEEYVDRNNDGLRMSVVGPFTTGTFSAGTGATGQGLLPGDFPAAALPQVQVQWQTPRQWIVDNNGNVHRVVIGRRGPQDPVQVRLSAPVPRAPDSRAWDNENELPSFEDYELPNDTKPGLRTMHYVPVIIDANGTQLVPIYATVRDL
jgi:prepilin-type N-terminal cleavage/methylation domain-containing protein